MISKHLSSAGKQLRSCLLGIGCVVAVMGVPQITHGAVVGYWSFDDDIAPNTAGTLSSAVNGPALNGTAGNSGSGSVKPAFSSQIPGLEISGSAGGFVNPFNEASLHFQNPDAPANPNSTSGGMVEVLDSGGASSLLKPASFTIEAFIKIEDYVNFAAIITKNRADGNGSSWMIDTDNGGHLRARFDTQLLGTSGSTQPGFNQNFVGSSKRIDDGQWHHIALTYDGTTRAAKLYLDYVQIAGGTVVNPLVYDDRPLRFGSSGGGRAFDGYMDEVRLSDTALVPSEFLYAVPEPGTAGMAALGLVAFGLRRRRRIA